MAETLNELRSRYEDFLRAERFNLVDRIEAAIDDYVLFTRERGKDIAGWGCPRVRIKLSEVRSQDGSLSQRLRLDPLRHLRALEAACHEIASEHRPGYDKENPRVKVALHGPIGAAPQSPRHLLSSSLRQLVCVEGVATKVSSIKPKVTRSVHFCPETKSYHSRDYVDATDPQLGLPAVDASGREIPDRIINLTSSIYPTKDKNGNKMETEFGLSTYKDHQTITLQEMPERAPMGQLPRSVELVLDHDLVDRIKPGDRVQIVGVYRALGHASTGQSSGIFKTVILVNNVQILGRQVSQLSFSTHDVRMIRELSKRPDILDILGRSFAPSIHGHDVIKKALVLQQLSGLEKNLDNGTHLRGDINVLMVGDPSTAKSQLLRSAMNVSPLSISTTGKGSSGVGLTAAVTSDSETGERRLEAGAMVLGDRGLVCVDEMDKMSENDRVAIHEAMEQQTVTIAKAGIHATLNARCSVLAAANPVYGQYDRSRRIQENVGLPDSLLSRFDLLFVVLDQICPVKDRRIASHVIKAHRCRSTNGAQNNGGPSTVRIGYDSDSDFEDDDDDDEDKDEQEMGEKSIWQRSPHLDYTLTVRGTTAARRSEDILQHDFLRKYLHFCKARQQPILTDEATEEITNRYAEMRSRQDERTLPITARSLETVIRLSTAHAKARLSLTVDAEPDVSRAMSILSFALYHENNGNDGNLEQVNTERAAGVASQDDNDDEPSAHPQKRQKREESRLESLKQRVHRELSQSDSEVAISDICKDVRNRDQIDTIVQELIEKNLAMEDDGKIYFLG